MSGNGIHLVGEEARKRRQAAKLNAQTMTRGEVIELLDTALTQFSTLVERALDQGKAELPGIMAKMLTKFWEDQDMPPIKPPRRGPEGIVDGVVGERDEQGESGLASGRARSDAPVGESGEPPSVSSSPALHLPLETLDANPSDHRVVLDDPALARHLDLIARGIPSKVVVVPEEPPLSEELPEALPE